MWQHNPCKYQTSHSDELVRASEGVDIPKAKKWSTVIHAVTRIYTVHLGQGSTLPGTMAGIFCTEKITDRKDFQRLHTDFISKSLLEKKHHAV